MNIIGEKVVLRAIEKKDNDGLLKLINDPQVEKMLGGNSFPVSEFSQNKWYESANSSQNVLRCVIADKTDEDKFIGTVILSDIDYRNGSAQIHIKILPGKFRGCGYGSDSVKTLVKYAFEEMRLNCVYADILVYNEPSKNMFLKCGFKLDGVLRGRVYKSGRFIDVNSYSILKDEF